jgi:hypothetical protein
MLSEADTRAKLLDPGLHARGWTEDLIRREETAGAIELSERMRAAVAPLTRVGRAGAFEYKSESWLRDLPPSTAATLKALAGQFARGGTEELENPQVFQTPDVVRAGWLDALKALGKPAEILRETKERLFAA